MKRQEKKPGWREMLHLERKHRKPGMSQAHLTAKCMLEDPRYPAWKTAQMTEAEERLRELGIGAKEKRMVRHAIYLAMQDQVGEDRFWKDARNHVRALKGNPARLAIFYEDIYLDAKEAGIL